MDYFKKFCRLSIKNTEIMIKDYYDKRYREKKKIPISEINSDDMETASDELIELYKKKYIF